tara:strand:- start:8737 stop:8841 length:105 start_codon:yes stop_codon:yes gene_type:complete
MVGRLEQAIAKSANVVVTMNFISDDSGMRKKWGD